ncbi:MAG TPA: T9SS type A sorting domain-containing protein [Chitinophagales bacterium]|nr:T9SS type A sorting domain-containing protein [Chitinophagales bacterium]
MLTPDGLTNQLTLTTTACATIGTLARYGEEVLDNYLNDPDAFLNNEMMAFPNPSNGAFTVNLFEIEHANLVVTNTLGEIVYLANDVSKFVPVVLENAPTGLYFVNAYYGDGKVITKTIVVE